MSTSTSTGTANIIDTKSPIWQNPDIGPDSSFAYINTSYDLAGNLEALRDCLSQVEQTTGCKTSVHGQWVKIKGQSSLTRRHAFSLINSFTDNSCKEIFLPSLDEVVPTEDRLATPSPPSSPELVKSTGPSQRKPGLTRSSTETFITSLQQHNTKSPFSSVLLPLSTAHQPRDSAISEEAAGATAPETAPVVISSNKSGSDESQRKRHKYSVDFLLLRSDVPNSKKLPSDWKTLNEKFPAICFCGKVLSYFNPYKYHEHWEKTKHTNYELHDSSDLLRYGPYATKKTASGGLKAYTDDFINVSRNGSDSGYNTGLNGGNSKFYRTNPQSEHSFHKSTSFYNYPTMGHGLEHKKAPRDFEPRQFQASSAFYQQENSHQQNRPPASHRQLHHQQPQPHKGSRFHYKPAAAATSSQHIFFD